MCLRSIKSTLTIPTSMGQIAAIQPSATTGIWTIFMTVICTTPMLVISMNIKLK